MRGLDFLSESPRNFIFQKEVNKTNFGGVLFLIYMIIMIIISLSYIFDFYLNERYEIEYISINNQTLGRDLNELDKNPDLNPTLEFKLVLNTRYSLSDEFKISDLNPTLEFKLVLNTRYSLSDEFKIYDNNNQKNHNLTYYIYRGSPSEEGLFLNANVSNFDFFLMFFCGNDSTCKKNEQKNAFNENTTINFEFRTTLPKIDHQNPSKPNL